MGFSEVRSHEPLGPGEGVVEVLLGGVVLVGRPPVVLPDEGEQAGPLVLPDGRRPVRGDDHLVAVPVTGEGGEEVAGGGLVDVVEPGAVGAADVALLVLWTPLSARHHVTSGNKRKFYLFIESKDTSNLNLETGNELTLLGLLLQTGV